MSISGAIKHLAGMKDSKVGCSMVYVTFNSYFQRELNSMRHKCQGRIQDFKRGVDGRPYLLRGARENALTKKIGNNFSCTCLRRVF